MTRPCSPAKSAAASSPASSSKSSFCAKKRSKPTLAYVGIAAANPGEALGKPVVGKMFIAVGARRPGIDDGLIEFGDTPARERGAPSRVGFDRFFAQNELFDDDAGLDAAALFAGEQGLVTQTDKRFQHPSSRQINHDNEGAPVERVAATDTFEFALGRFVQVDRNEAPMVARRTMGAQNAHGRRHFLSAQWIQRMTSSGFFHRMGLLHRRSPVATQERNAS